MNNLKITLSYEYEDKEGGHIERHEDISGDLFDLKTVEDNVDGMAGRMLRRLAEFRDREPLPMDDEPESEEDGANADAITAHD